MAWWGWVGLGLLSAHLLVIGLRITAWEVLGARWGRGTKIPPGAPNWPLMLMSWMMWWSAWQ